MPIYELQFSVQRTEEKGPDAHNTHKTTKIQTNEMFALVAGDNEGAALAEFMQMWAPPGKLLNVQVRISTKYFQIHIPSTPSTQG